MIKIISCKKQNKKISLTRPALSKNNSIQEKTKEIISEVRLKGDKALFQFTEKFDQVKLKNLTVSISEINDAEKKINSKEKDAILFAKKQIEKNQFAQLPKNIMLTVNEGVTCERQARAIQRVGLYIPGGSAPLVSTLLMLAVPATLAQCPEIILCTPPDKKGEINPAILFAANCCGISSIYKIGGAQAIAAMAYGTKTIPKVNKIFGPGNAWVTQAKILVSENPEGASIDLPAGPSELMVIADNEANECFVAADLLSQAEHGADSQVTLIALSQSFALNVIREIKKQINNLPRKNIIKKSLTKSRIILVNTIEQAIEISNAYAPEHLILNCTQPEKYKSLIQNAGAVFLGAWSPETVGDYVTGSNHILPTYGYARCYSGLSVTDFMKFISFQTVTLPGLKIIGKYAEKLAEIETLDAHKNAVSLRLNKGVTDE